MTIQITRATGIGLVGAVLIVVGTMLPWLSAPPLSVSGLDLGGDVIILLAAAIVGVLGLVWGTRVGAIHAVAAGGVGLLSGLGDLNQLRDSATLAISVGPGIFVAIVGAVLLASGAYMRRSEA